MQGQEIQFVSKMSRLALKHIQPPIQWVLWALSLAVKWSGCEINKSSLLHSHYNPGCSRGRKDETSVKTQFIFSSGVFGHVSWIEYFHHCAVVEDKWQE